MTTFKTEAHDTFTLLTFEIPGGVLDPAELATIELPPDLPMTKGIVIGGRGPVWLYAHLCHLAHPFAWVATQDPRLGAVCVQRHKSDAPALGAISLGDDK